LAELAHAKIAARIVAAGALGLSYGSSGYGETYGASKIPPPLRKFDVSLMAASLTRSSPGPLNSGSGDPEARLLRYGHMDDRVTILVFVVMSVASVGLVALALLLP
jgi:hypothetical protein